MELPRIASHTSISPTNIELLNYNQVQVSEARRTPVASRRLLSAYVTDAAGANGNASVSGGPQPPQLPPPPQFNSLSGAGAGFQPSRRREEACALSNLKKRVQALRVHKANQQETLDAPIAAFKDNHELDNRPQLFQKVTHTTLTRKFTNKTCK